MELESLGDPARLPCPGPEKEANWLPAPNDMIYLVMRVYWLKNEAPSILPPGNGSWKPPGIVKAK